MLRKPSGIYMRRDGRSRISSSTSKLRQTSVVNMSLVVAKSAARRNGAVVVVVEEMRTKPRMVSELIGESPQ